MPKPAAKPRPKIIDRADPRAERVPAKDLQEHPHNWRTHPEHQRAVMRDLFAEVGFVKPVDVYTPTDSDPLVLAGKLKPGVPCILDGHLRTEELGSRYMVPINRTSLDEAGALKYLATCDPLAALAGRNEATLDTLLAEARLKSERVLAMLKEASPAPPIPPGAEEHEPVVPTDALVLKWGTAAGQLWTVPSLTTPGRAHRLLCGDCRDPATVARLHDGARPALGLHDPPYGIDIVARPVDQRRGGAQGAPRAAGGGIGDGRKHGRALSRRGKFAPIEGDRGAFDPAHLLATKPGALVLWGANHYADKLPPSPGVIVWDKRAGMAESENDFSDGELAWVSRNASGRLRIIRHLWNGLVRASEKGEKRLHPTQKPIAVQRQIVEWHSKPGDVVADWYMGAGAVGLACEATARIFHGMDIAPAYLAATLERMSLRGLKPERAPDP